MKKLWLGGRKLTKQDVEAVGGIWEITMKSDRNSKWWFIYGIHGTRHTNDLWNGVQAINKEHKSYAMSIFAGIIGVQINHPSRLTHDPRRLP